MNADQLKNKANSIIGGGGYDTKTVRTRATVAGACVGGLFGVYYGYTKRKNILAMTLIGGVTGAILSRLLVPKE